MFHFFPRGQQDWLRVLAFPFQAFVILAPVTYFYLLHIWPHRGEVSHLNHFADQLAPGYLFCFIVLLAVGFRQKSAGYRVDSYFSFCLAVLSILLVFITPHWAQV
jgi:hypothetical protein